MGLKIGNIVSFLYAAKLLFDTERFHKMGERNIGRSHRYSQRKPHNIKKAKMRRRMQRRSRQINARKRKAA